MRIGILLIATATLGLAALAGGAASARAASASAAAPPTDISSQQRQEPRRRIPRITVVPLSRYYRKCDFWLAVEHRPSGDVITPQQHCVWALR